MQQLFGHAAHCSHYVETYLYNSQHWNIVKPDVSNFREYKYCRRPACIGHRLIEVRIDFNVLFRLYGCEAFILCGKMHDLHLHCQEKANVTQAKGHRSSWALAVAGANADLRLFLTPLFVHLCLAKNYQRFQRCASTGSERVNFSNKFEHFSKFHVPVICHIIIKLAESCSNVHPSCLV